MSKLSKAKKEELLEQLYNNLDAAASASIALNIDYHDFGTLASYFMHTNAIDLGPTQGEALANIHTIRQTYYHVRTKANPLIQKLNDKYLRY